MKPPLCFVVMPSGRRPASDGRIIDFDRVYQDLIAPAIQAGGLDPLRADEAEAGGFIPKAMFEGLAICEYAVADLTLANPNVFYELGIRHAVRPWSTVQMTVEGVPLPIDVHALRTMHYAIDDLGNPVAERLEGSRTRLTDLLRAARSGPKDSLLYQLLDYSPAPLLDHEKTDVFRDRVAYSAVMKTKLRAARSKGVEAIREVEQELGDFASAEAGVLVDMMLSYRARSAWKEMIALIERFPAPLGESVMAREQLALALNRDNQRERAVRLLLELIERRGPSSETNAILGRVYKDEWEDAKKGGDGALARGLLDQAIEAYLHGFEADWRDAYPGINAVTLMEMREPPDPRRLELLPMVRYAVARRIAKGKPDYWDRATMLELAVLASDRDAAFSALDDALACVREKWEPETTARSIRSISDSREHRGEGQAWLRDIESALDDAAK
jgi:tetratricopeptide (TPR) repeat protein